MLLSHLCLFLKHSCTNIGCHREHRQRKENHVKTLEQEISDLRDMIESVEKQSHLFQLENDDLKKLLQRKESVNRLNVPVRIAPQSSSHIRTPVSDNSDLLEDQKFFEAIASVDYDQFLDISYLQLSSGNDFGLASSPSSESRTREVDSMMGGVEVKSESVAFDRFDERREVQMDSSYDDPELALLAINFILAYVSRFPLSRLDFTDIGMYRLEHPCRTHFLPKGVGPIPGLPVLPAHVPSGHECTFHP